MQTSGTIYKVGAIILNARKQILVVRKYLKDQSDFIIPGGRQEKNENDEQTLVRELQEELGVTITSFEYFGRYEELAIFKKVPLIMSVYKVEVAGEPSPKREIKEYAWVDRDFESKGYTLGTVLSKHVIPQLIADGKM